MLADAEASQFGRPGRPLPGWPWVRHCSADAEPGAWFKELLGPPVQQASVRSFCSWLGEESRPLLPGEMPHAVVGEPGSSCVRLPRRLLPLGSSAHAVDASGRAEALVAKNKALASRLGSRVRALALRTPCCRGVLKIFGQTQALCCCSASSTRCQEGCSQAPLLRSADLAAGCQKS